MIIFVGYYFTIMSNVTMSSRFRFSSFCKKFAKSGFVISYKINGSCTNIINKFSFIGYFLRLFFRELYKLHSI
ncbi:hypothetical protein GCM10023260_08570 [Bartonella acomydis]|uniref:Uncharacterized protein n=1 Tax=Bartonella acomydis TaxID=686234 RepID=A0ABP9MKS4_9HYPH